MDQPPVVRIPVRGPAPFNTLAVVRTRAFVTEYEAAHEDLRRRRIEIPTALVLADFDPRRPEQQRVDHSSSATLQMAQTSAEADLFTDDNVNFLFAVDGVATESRLDEQGRWYVSVDVAEFQSNCFFAGYAEVSSWVLCFEPRAVEPEPIEVIRRRAFTGWASHLLSAYRVYGHHPRADLVKAAQELSQLSGRLSAGEAASDAITTQQLAVDLIRSVTPPDDDRADYVLIFAETRHNLIARLLDVRRTADARALAGETVDGYAEYGLLPGADGARLARDLGELAHQLDGAGLAEDALRAQNELVEVFRRRAATEDAPSADSARQLAESLHNLVARLIDAGHTGDIEPVATEAIAAYQAYAQLPTADRASARHNLEVLAALLDRADLPTLAVRARSAAQDLGA